jgi:tetratricopeptide (TPR) repeat protein
LKRKVCTILALLTCITQVRCASLSSALAINSKPPSSRIASPFSSYQPGSETAQNMILRTKQGDRTLELEIPGDSNKLGEFALPLSPTFLGSDRGPASAKNRSTDATGMLDESYKNRAPSLSDRELLHSRSQGFPADEQKRHEIEESLSLSPSEDSIPAASSSYLGGIDHIKQLYRLARFEVALVETDEMIKQYPTDATLYEMRGTLMDRLGRRELALQAWNQSLRFEPKNAGLRRFIDRKRNANITAGAQ